MAEPKLNLVWELIKMALKAISPQIKEMVRDFVKKLEEAAQNTPNPIDNIFVMILKIILSMDE